MKRNVEHMRRLMLAGLGVGLMLPALALAANLLTNGNFVTFSNIPDRSWNGFNEKVGTGWDYFYIDSETREGKLHWFSSQDFGTAFGGLNYRLEGDYAQNMWSSYEFDAGIYQRVTGLITGTVYAFDVPVVTYWRGPGYPISDGIMKKRVGIDPYGGTDAASPNVIWSEVDSNDKEWVYMELAAQAESEAMTFFVRIQAPENDSYNHFDLDMVYIDAAKVDLAPTVSLTVPTVSTSTVTFSWAGSAADGWSIKGVEVKYRDELDGTWLTVPGDSSPYSFPGQPGHTYTVRARPWQTTSESYNSDIDMPGLWVEKSTVVGGAFSGYVLNNFGVGVGGALVSAGTSSTASESGGFYGLQPASYGQPYTLTVSDTNYLSPMPIISQTVVSETSITPITFTLKPANDVITNGDLEIDTTGWFTAGTGSAAVFSGGHRSGVASLELTGNITLTQAAALSGVYNPTLSFWYKGDDTLLVNLEGSTGSASRSFTAFVPDRWQYGWLPLNQRDLYTGTLTVDFYLDGGQISLDEVSLGDGPHTVFLPIIFRSLAT
jgi:hypothetical protein